MAGTLYSVAHHAHRCGQDPYAFADPVNTREEFKKRYTMAWYGKVYIDVVENFGMQLESARLVVEVGTVCKHEAMCIHCMHTLWFHAWPRLWLKCHCGPKHM